MRKAVYLLPLYALGFLFTSCNAKGQCADPGNIYTFTYNGQTYEIIKENKTWVDAAACAVERGGMLAEINDAAENQAIYNELINNAGITNSNTVAPDGGGGAYVWIGGNDLGTEGSWIWDGDNDSNGSQFWQGTSSGNPVGGLYNNWGNEPDDYNGQDALGLSLNGWPLGVAGQWNDVDDGNTLYFVVEYPSTSGLNELKSELKVYPNPFTSKITIENDGRDIDEIRIYNASGEEVKVFAMNKSAIKEIDLSDLDRGMYLLAAKTTEGEIRHMKLMK